MDYMRNRLLHTIIPLTKLIARMTCEALNATEELYIYHDSREEFRNTSSLFSTEYTKFPNHLKLRREDFGSSVQRPPTESIL